MSEEKKPEMTGGTPNGGRQAPGAERAFCQRQRSPLIVGKLAGELQSLFKQAVAVAEHMSHRVILWRMVESENCGSVRCEACHAVAGFALFPMAGKDKVNGPAVETRCPGKRG